MPVVPIILANWYIDLLRYDPSKLDRLKLWIKRKLNMKLTVYEKTYIKRNQ